MNDSQKASAPSTVLLPAKDLTDAIASMFAAAGAGADEAGAIAENLVGANLAGHDSHGVVRVPRYLLAEKSGQMHFGKSVETVLDGEAFTLLDGQMGFGQVLGRQAVEAGLAKAEKHGVAVVALRRAGHLGRIGAWAEMACAAGYVSVHFVNVARSMLVAPFGGAERRMSTAPVTIGIANPGGGDFILDFATSKSAEGKVLVALKSNMEAPEGALVDGDGKPTRDPSALYGDVAPGEVPNPRAGPGALLAMGDHKGSGLAIACELLAGALTGSGPTGPGQGPYNGMLSIYISPKIMDDGHGFAKSVADYIDYVRASAPIDPENPVMVPGDPERKAREKRMVDGLPLSRDTWQSLLDAAEGAKLDTAKMAQLARPV